MLLQSHKRRVFILLLSISILFVPSVSADQTQEQPLGQLKIEGSHIEQLVLRAINGQTKTFDNPQDTIKLPAGTYYLQQVNLKNGFSCNFINDRIVITEDKPAVLKVGAPLKQTIDVKRQGRLLVLNYKLTGQGGENYRDQSRREKPAFTVYKGDKVISSGNFEYG
jgi:hypothetical protein